MAFRWYGQLSRVVALPRTVEGTLHACRFIKAAAAGGGPGVRTPGSCWPPAWSCATPGPAAMQRDYESGFPVHVDGTCNGLQHYAALGRDKKGGQAVNLLTSEKPEVRCSPWLVTYASQRLLALQCQRLSLHRVLASTCLQCLYGCVCSGQGTCVQPCRVQCMMLTEPEAVAVRTGHLHTRGQRSARKSPGGSDWSRR